MVGVGMGLCAFGLLQPTQGTLFAAAGFAGALLGSTAPDWLELPQKPTFWGTGGKRLIPHRTLTHWWPLWVWLFISTLHMQGTLISALLEGFALGGLSHLVVDLPNPMGVPFATPFASSRKSLKWWRSGQHEFLIISVFIAIGLLTLWLRTAT